MNLLMFLPVSVSSSFILMNFDGGDRQSIILFSIFDTPITVRDIVKLTDNAIYSCYVIIALGISLYLLHMVRIIPGKISQILDSYTTQIDAFRAKNQQQHPNSNSVNTTKSTENLLEDTEFYKTSQKRHAILKQKKSQLLEQARLKHISKTKTGSASFSSLNNGLDLKKHQ